MLRCCDQRPATSRDARKGCALEPCPTATLAVRAPGESGQAWVVEPNTWIVVADGARARIYSRRRPGDPLVPALDRDLVGTRLTEKDLESDRPGRTNSRSGRVRHAVGGEMDKHRHAQVELARAVAKELEAARCAGLRALVLVAPPRALGDLREACNEHVRALITQEHPKDLSRLPEHELTARLEELLGPSS